MDWSDICELRAWLRERVQVSIIQIMFSLYFLFMRCWETLTTTFLQSETHAEISRWVLVLRDLKEKISSTRFLLYLESFCHSVLHPCVLDVNVTSPLSFALCIGNCLDVVFLEMSFLFQFWKTLPVFFFANRPKPGFDLIVSSNCRFWKQLFADLWFNFYISPISS